ncbi:MAG: cation:proton antiporter [Bacteroidetes bacterium]|jgi:Kef-type K+ transport system membrane component KefB|nr:cation:proton antiporter [Bacteroidota bacterium]
MIELITHEFQRPLGNPVLAFSVILLIILLSPIVLRKLKIPGIVGLIISGVIVGPFGLNLIERNSAVDLFSTIGLLYIMFIAGLELDLNEFRKQRNKSLIFGFLTFIIPLGIGYPVCYYLLGYDFYASLLIASMFSTHTLVAYPIVSRMGVSKNQAVAITVGGTILTDTAVLILLAVIMSSSKGSLESGFWIQLGVSVAVFSAIMFYLIPRIAEWFFKKLESEKHSHYIFVLAVVFFAAFLAEIAGVEPIIGAFVSGLVLNRLIPQSSALMNRIEFIGSSLFIPFFLISVGMLVDVGIILKGPEAVYIAATLTIVALLGKWLAAKGTQLLFKYSNAQGNLIFGLSSSHAAATIAVILVGFQNGLLDENILNGTIILILVTCIVASVITENAAKKVLLSTEETAADMETPVLISEKILMPIANIANIEKLLEFGSFIRDKKSELPITILSVVPNNTEAEQNLQKARKMLQGIEQHASASDTKVALMATIDHNASGGIARTAKETMASIVLLGWPQRAGVIENLIGNKMDSIIHNIDKTIFICHFSKPLVSHKRLVMAVPPLAELEQGFDIWSAKIIQLASELGISAHYFCNPEGEKAIRNNNNKQLIAVKTSFEYFDTWEEVLSLSGKVNEDDILVLVSARKGAISYFNTLDNLPLKIEKQFESFSRVIIFPQQPHIDYINERYRDLDAAPILRGVETLGKLGKEVGGFFRKGE